MEKVTTQSSEKYLLMLVGPTAVGKTSMAINLAKKFNTEIVSCDSRQFYKEMELGTAKPDSQELMQVPHHLIDNLSIHEDYDVRRFEGDALKILDSLFQNHDIVVMTGGSGLFVDAIVKGFDEIPEIGNEVRDSLIRDYEEKGLPFLQDELKKVDPEYFDLVDRMNPQRLMRGIEVFRGTGKKFSSYRNRKPVNRPFKTIELGLELDREVLYERINRRMDLMIEAGLFEEAEKLFSFRHLNALQTVGYSEIFGFMEGEYDREEAIRLLKRNSRRYAKRQLTWFRKNEKIVWFNPNQESEIIEYVESQLMA